MSKPHAPDGERLYELLLRLGRLIQAGERMSGAPLLPVQLNALHYLGRANRYSNTPQAVAEYLGVTKGTGSQTLRALEQRGLIERRTDKDDRRVQRLVVTTAGKRLIRRVIPPATVAAAARDLGEHCVGALEEDLQGLLRSLQRSHGGRAFGVCKTCRHFQPSRRGRGGVCGLTSEPLRAVDATLLCREHEAEGSTSDGDLPADREER